MLNKRCSVRDASVLELDGPLLLRDDELAWRVEKEKEKIDDSALCTDVNTCAGAGHDSRRQAQ